MNETLNDKKPCVFLVDDNIANLNLGKATLQHNYTVITVPSGEKLFAALKNLKPDLILLDIEMPGLSGYDTIKGLKINPETANIPVIFLTSRNKSEDELLGFSLGAVDYITKPFSQPILLKRVELHLLLQNQQEMIREYSKNLLDLVNVRTDHISTLQNAVITWAAEVIEFRDSETGHHVERVQKYLEIMLREMTTMELFSEEVALWDEEAFLNSALLHDVGKIKIRDDVLLKPARLTHDEFVKMKLHSLYGKMLLEKLEERVPSPAFLQYAKVLAHRHHEKWDGTGYPDGLKGEEIPLQARMMALADVYDALISERPYKNAFSHEEAMKIISGGRGTQFDPDLTDIFIKLSDEIKNISEGVTDAQSN